MEKVSFKSISLGCLVSTFGWEFLEDAWLTPFLNNRGQELAVELVMTRVNEDGLWRIGRVGEEVSS